MACGNRSPNRHLLRATQRWTTKRKGAIMELFEAIYTLRSMRRLKPDPIPDEAIRTILDAAIRAASGGNQQTWAFIVVRDQAIKEEIAAIYLEGWRALKATGYGQAPPDATDEVRR